jgi:ADP-ribosylation factor GTPase-activating protein 1
VPIDESKKDFWDSFAEAGAARQQQARPSAVGTSAIKKGNAGGGMGGGMGGGGGKKDEWDEW